VSGALQHGDDDPIARCVHCANVAAGPCASCHQPVCGDCSTLTEGGARVWAICLECDRRKGRSLSRAWWSLLLWLAALLAGLALVTWLLERLVRVGGTVTL
jgi:hypothetical protein